MKNLTSRPQFPLQGKVYPSLDSENLEVQVFIVQCLAHRKYSKKKEFSITVCRHYKIPAKENISNVNCLWVVRFRLILLSIFPQN